MQVGVGGKENVEKKLDEKQRVRKTEERQKSES